MEFELSAVHETARDREEAIDCSSAIFSAEKEHRIGHTEEMVYPPKAFLFTGADDAYVLIGQPFVGASFPAKDLWSLFVRLTVRAVHAQAVLHVSEGWSASRCDACGARNGETDDCGSCGTPACDPSESQYRKEILVAMLERDTAPSCGWMAHIVRDASNTIVGYDPETTNASMTTSLESAPRFGSWWRFPSWMVVHCLRNLQCVARALGCNLQPHDEDMAIHASSLLIPSEICLRVDPVQLEHCIRRVNIAGLRQSPTDVNEERIDGDEDET